MAVRHRQGVTYHAEVQYEAPYPVNPPDAIEGKAYRTPRKDRNEDNKDDVLVVGDSGVTFQSGETRSRVRYDDCVACLAYDAEVAFWSSDGFYVLVDPTEWTRGDQAVARARAAPVDPAVVVRLDREPPPFEDEDLVQALAAFDAEEWERAVELFEHGLARSPDEPSRLEVPRVRVRNARPKG